MIEKREAEWQELETKAERMLENPWLLPRDAILKFYKPILRLWIYPSFSPYKVWIFCKPDFRTINLKTLIIREVTWDRNADFDRLEKPLEGLKKGFDTDPRFKIKSIEIEKEMFDNIFSELKQIHFPPSPITVKQSELTEFVTVLKLLILRTGQTFLGGVIIRKNGRISSNGLKKQQIFYKLNFPK